MLLRRWVESVDTHQSIWADEMRNVVRRTVTEIGMVRIVDQVDAVVDLVVGVVVRSEGIVVQADEIVRIGMIESSEVVVEVVEVVDEEVGDEDEAVDVVEIETKGNQSLVEVAASQGEEVEANQKVVGAREGAVNDKKC